MEGQLRAVKNSRNQQSLGTLEKTITAQAIPSQYLCDRFRLEKGNLSYADLHHEIRKDVKDISSLTSQDHQKQHRKASKEELVKYMSNLPSYLERGENHQEKVLNVGVLDWGRLEKWQCSQKRIPQSSHRHSLSISNSSSPLSTERSSVCSSRGQSCSPFHQKMRHPSLQFHLMSSSAEAHTQLGKSYEESSGKLKDVRSAETTTAEGEKVNGTDQLSKSDVKLDQLNRSMDPKINPVSGTFNCGLNHEAMQLMKAQMKSQASEFLNRTERSQERKAYALNLDVSQKSETVIVVRRRDLPQGSHAEVHKPSEQKMVLGQRATDQRIFSEVEGRPEIKGMSRDTESIVNLPDSAQSVSCPSKMAISPSQDRISEFRRSIREPTNSTLKTPSMGLDTELSRLASEKVRSTSPFRRFSIGVGKIIGLTETSSTPHFRATDSPAKSRPKSAVPSFCKDGSGSETQNAASRARSSPLRRLFDPLLKPKALSCHHSGELSEKESILSDSSHGRSDEQLDSSTGTKHPRTLRSDMTTSMMIKTNGSSLHRKQKAALQGLLRVAVKNGQLLFTFAVDDEPNILAATMKKLSTHREDNYRCIYTFFAIEEVKKKNGRWINQGGKGKGHDYVPNVVAQLKVSGTCSTNLIREGFTEHSFAREFVLFAADLRQAEQEALDFRPNDELAAIVVGVPKMANSNAVTDGNHSDNCDYLPERLNSASGENVENQPITSGQSLIKTTVILPSGIHSIPSKGGPSSLVQRWRSGGSCDCGGWDLGCNLRIFTNQNHFSKIPSSSKDCLPPDKLEFISQGGEDGNQTVFSLAPFKEGIYSVEFDASLSILQAFSICIAVLDCRKLCATSGSSSSFEEKTSLQTILRESDGLRASSGVEDIPARYVSYPPVSPVGRV